jgi:hypothetical protein
VFGCGVLLVSSRPHMPTSLWNGRFGAAAMDEEHLAAALAYVSRNSVRAAAGRAGGGQPLQNFTIMSHHDHHERCKATGSGRSSPSISALCSRSAV